MYQSAPGLHPTLVTALLEEIKKTENIYTLTDSHDTQPILTKKKKKVLPLVLTMEMWRQKLNRYLAPIESSVVPMTPYSRWQSSGILTGAGSEETAPNPKHTVLKPVGPTSSLVVQ